MCYYYRRRKGGNIRLSPFLMPFALAKGWKTGASVGSVQCACMVLHGGEQYKRNEQRLFKKVL